MKLTVNYMSNISRTAAGLGAILVGFLFQWKGVPVAEGEIETAISKVIEVCGLIFALYGQFMRRDLSMGVFRK